jgi:hypothetical protein
MPCAAKVSPFGLDFARATSAFTDAAGLPGGTTRMCAVEKSRVTGAKSAAGS